MKRVKKEHLNKDEKSNKESLATNDDIENPPSPARFFLGPPRSIDRGGRNVLALDQQNRTS